MPLQATSGAASYDAFGGGVAAVPNYIEDVFSTWLYTGNGSTQTINNGIDLAGKGGLVWTKSRGGGASNDHILKDTVRGGANWLYSNNTFEQQTGDTGFSFGSTGFTLSSSSLQNQSTVNHVSWTFREQPKFFDVVTYTGNGVSGRQIPHSLGSVPGCMIVKGTSIAENWTVYHRSQGATKFGLLDQTDAFATSNDRWNDTTPTSTVFTVGNAAKVNASGQTYVAYLFAHDSGGFGLSGTDNVISCGSYTGTGTSGNFVTLGYEPQWVLIKRASVAGNDWILFDNMRGMPVGTADSFLRPNTTAAEDSLTDYLSPTATGFELVGGSSNTNTSGDTYIYIAIRRGPMRTPTTGTSVFAPVAQNSAGTVTTNFPVDLMLGASRNIAHNTYALDRLRGSSTNSFAQLRTDTTSAESSGTGVGIGLDNNTGFVDNWFIPSGSGAASGSATAYWNFRRAPGFFDEVCYNGNSSTQTITHNLAAVPELMIVKIRNGVSGWPVYSIALGNTKFVRLNTTSAESVDNVWANTSPTSSSFTVGNNGDVNQSGGTYVAYLFASCPGVSKVFNFTGNGSSQTINCGFTGGARFVMIKRTDSTGDWYVWDSARGIVSGNDPRLSLNTTSAEVTTDDSVDTDSTGFVVNQLSATNINVSSATYIGIAIA